MDKIEKLLRKISKKQRQMLFRIIEKLLNKNNQGLNITKVTDTDFYRLKKGRFRILFHYENKEIIIDSIKLRNEKTYK